MTDLYIDADACPVKAEAERVAVRHGVRMFLVSNGGIRPPAHPLVESIFVPEGPDVADMWIADRARTGDVVVTSDIPLAAKVVAAGALVVKPNGETLTQANIGNALATRDLMADLRSADPFRQGGGRPFPRPTGRAFSTRWNVRCGRHRRRAAPPPEETRQDHEYRDHRPGGRGPSELGRTDDGADAGPQAAAGRGGRHLPLPGQGHGAVARGLDRRAGPAREDGDHLPGQWRGGQAHRQRRGDALFRPRRHARGAGRFPPRDQMEDGGRQPAGGQEARPARQPRDPARGRGQCGALDDRGLRKPLSRRALHGLEPVCGQGARHGGAAGAGDRGSGGGGAGGRHHLHRYDEPGSRW